MKISTQVGLKNPHSQVVVSDRELGTTCLDSLSKLDAEGGMAYLLACISEAQCSGNRKQAIMALDQVLKKQDRLDSQNTKISLPALLRYEIADVVGLIDLLTCSAALLDL